MARVKVELKKNSLILPKIFRLIHEYMLPVSCPTYRVPRNLRIDIKDRLEEYPHFEVPYPQLKRGQQSLGALVAVVRHSVTYILI